jgi:hypothetical protein
MVPVRLKHSGLLLGIAFRHNEAGIETLGISPRGGFMKRLDLTEFFASVVEDVEEIPEPLKVQLRVAVSEPGTDLAAVIEKVLLDFPLPNESDDARAS